MKAIPPLEITPARLTSTTAAEPGPGETPWSATEICAAGEQRILGTLAATVTISIASPAVVTWVDNNLAVGTQLIASTTGALPTGITAGPVFYLRHRLTKDNFTISATPLGAVISTSGSQSGTHTFTAHVHRIYEALVGAKADVSISNATPAVVSWTTHGRAADDPIVFTNSGGSLPTGVTAGKTYYVLATDLTADTFKFAESRGGTAINTSSAGSGTHTCGLAANYNKPPLLNTDVWADSAPTNKYACLDLRRTDATAVASPLTLVITPATRVDSIGLAGLDADLLQVSETSGGSPIYDSGSISLHTRSVRNWYEYFHKAFQFKKAYSLFDLPPVTNAVITVTLTRSGGNVECGAIVIGMQEDMGEVKFRAMVETLNFTEVTRDRYSVASVDVQRNVPQVNLQLWVQKANLDAWRETEEALNGQVAFWAGVEDSDDGYFASLQVLGFYRKVSKNLALPNHVEISLQLEEI